MNDEGLKRGYVGSAISDKTQATEKPRNTKKDIGLLILCLVAVFLFCGAAAAGSMAGMDLYWFLVGDEFNYTSGVLQ